MIKECKCCRKTLPVEQFSKRKASPDGLQLKCKSCNKIDNEKFRKVINPEHHAKWQFENRVRAAELVSKWRKADKTSKIYYIKAPDGLHYIGMTQTHLSVRCVEHKVKFNRWMSGKKTTQHPNLFESFKKWGVDKHEVGILFESDDMDRKTLRQIEKAFIKSFKDLGIALNHKI
jgi:hypothetical protein